MADIRLDANDDESTKRFLEAVMNRYDLRPSDAGRMLHEIDALAAKIESKHPE